VISTHPERAELKPLRQMCMPVDPGTADVHWPDEACIPAPNKSFPESFPKFWTRDFITRREKARQVIFLHILVFRYKTGITGVNV
jgi:hypothetical protein